MSFVFRFLTFLAIFASVTPLNAKKTTIKGSAPEFTNASLHLYRYTDLLNLTEERVATAQIGENGQFELAIDLQHTERLSLRIDDKTGALYTQPGNVLNIVLTYDEALNRSKLYDKQLSVSFSFPQPNEINGLFIQFMKDYNQFVVDNEKSFITNSALTAIKRFTADQKKKHINTENKAFLHLLELNLSLLFDAAFGSKRQTFEKHFNGQPIAYYDYDYMALFRQFYAHCFEQLALGKNGMKILSAVNGTFNYQQLLEFVKADPYVNQQDTLAELVLIYGLGEAYYDKEFFKPKSVLAALNYISLNGMSEIHRKIAGNVVQRLTYLKPGTTAPAISVKNDPNKPVDLSLTGKKARYIQFWSTQSPSSMREMVLINALHTKYQSTIDFVSINMDKKGISWKPEIEKKNYKWTFTVPMDPEELKRRYQLNNYPIYLLISKDGKIIQYPAASPTESIEKTLYDLSNKP